MVLILNGEILQDSDPRAKAHRAAAAGGAGASSSASSAPSASSSSMPNPWARGSPQQQRQRQLRAGGSNNGGSAPPPQPRPPALRDDSYVPEPLRYIDETLGLKGKSIPVPGMNGKRMPLIFVAIIAVAALAFGRQVGGVLLVAIGIYWHQNACAQEGADTRAMPLAARPGGHGGGR